jgi:hypothetical protein
MHGSAAYVRPTGAWVFGIRNQDARAERHRRPMPVLAALLRGAGIQTSHCPLGRIQPSMPSNWSLARDQVASGVGVFAAARPLVATR